LERIAGILRKHVRRGIPLLGTIAVGGAVVAQISVPDLWRHAEVPTLWAALSILVLFGLNTLLVTLRLSWFLSFFGRMISFPTVLRASLAGLLSSLLVIGLVGTIVGRQAMLHKNEVALTRTALIATYERAVLAATGGILFLGSVVVLLGADQLDRILTQALGGSGYPALLTGLAVAVILNAAFVRSGAERRLMARTLSARSSIFLGKILVLTGLSFCLTASCFVVLLVSIGYDGDFGGALAAAMIVTFAASLPISVNGWGVRELASIWAFGYLGVPPVQAVTISVAVGIIASLAVVIIGAVVFLRKTSGNNPIPPSLSNDPPQVAVHADFVVDGSDRTLGLLIPIVVSILLFFQFRLVVDGTEVTANLADPISIIALTVLCLRLALSGGQAFNIHRIVAFWVLGLGVMLLLGFLIGYARHGLIEWALNNRLLGWLVIMGYFSAGCLIATFWGGHGRRRLCEALVITSAAVVFVHAGQHIAQFGFGLNLGLTYNFEGFSTNRNAFAFQLCMALCGAIACGHGWSRQPRGRFIWILMTSIVLFGLFFTGSKAGLAVGLGLLAVSILTPIGHRRDLILGTLLAIVLILSYLFLPILLAQTTEDLESLAHANESRRLLTLSAKPQFERLQNMLDALAIWRGHPFFGAGLGTFFKGSAGHEGDAIVIHSTVIWILAEFGAVGFLFAASLPAFGAFLAIRSFPNWRNQQVRLLVLVGLTFSTFGLVHDVSYQRAFWLLLGTGVCGAATAARARLTRR
jgi:uncharacterized membrane protein YbhN (UPF0104 family)